MNLYLVNIEGVKNNIGGVVHYKILRHEFVVCKDEESAPQKLKEMEFKIGVYGHSADSWMITNITFIKKVE